jgi:hypothetical protein
LIAVEASSSLYVGGMVAINSNGRAVKGQVPGASPLDTLKVAGICEYVYAGGIVPPGVDALNQTGSGGLFPGATATLGTAGAISVSVVAGIFGMDVDSSITDATCIGKLAFVVDDHTVGLADGSGGTTVANTTSITMPSSAPLINVLKPYILPGSFNAFSASGGGGTKYTENTDYAVNYQSGLFTVLAGSAISAGGTVFITYKWGLPTKVAAGEIVAYEGGLAYVNFMKQSLRSVNGTPVQGN